MTFGETPRNTEVTYVDCLVQSVPWKQASGPWLRGVFRPDELASEVVLRRFGERKAKTDQPPDGNEWKPAIGRRVELRGFVFNA